MKYVVAGWLHGTGLFCARTGGDPGFVVGFLLVIGGTAALMLWPKERDA